MISCFVASVIGTRWIFFFFFLVFPFDLLLVWLSKALKIWRSSRFGSQLRDKNVSTLKLSSYSGTCLFIAQKKLALNISGKFLLFPEFFLNKRSRWTERVAFRASHRSLSYDATKTTETFEQNWMEWRKCFRESISREFIFYVERRTEQTRQSVRKFLKKMFMLLWFTRFMFYFWTWTERSSPLPLMLCKSQMM